MTTKTRSIKRATKPKTIVKRRKATTARKSGSSKRLVNFFVPLFFILCIAACLSFLFFMGYRTVTASSFFDAKTIDIQGANRASRDEMEKIVRSQTEKNGVWNANLETIRNEIEKLTFVKSAAVSRVLPNGIQVRIDERIPKAVARLSNGDFWVDEDAVIVSPVGKTEQRPSFILRGWNESKTDKANKDNKERIRLYLKMLSELQNAGIADRVKMVNFADLQDLQVTVEDSGETVAIFLGKEDFGKRLQKGLEVIAGKGQRIESLVSHGNSVVAKYRNS